MKRFLGRNIMRGALLLASMLLVFACGRNETMASKSAAAYREAQAKGTPVTGGHEHGGHAAATASTGTETMDHSAHGTGADPHAGHDMTASGTADHAQHGATTGSAAHDQHAAMQHGTSTASADPHAQHRQPTAAAAHAGHGTMQPTSASAPSVVLKAPTTSAEIAGMQPAATLRPDDFDAPSPIAVAEAQKAAAGGGAHEGHGSSSGASAQTIYTCPMHPEVTSTTPGSCPKCGMTLVKKEK